MKQAISKRKSSITKAQPTKEQIIETFLASQDVRASTKYRYNKTLNQFFTWIESHSYQLHEITRIEVLQYKEELLASGMSSLTVGSYITSVRRLYDWVEANRMGPNVAKGIKSPKRKQQFKKQHLTETQGRELLDHYRNKNLRDYAIISLLLHTGLRTIEVVRADVEDITFKLGKRVLLVHGKGRDEKDSFVILTNGAYKPIEDYLNSRPRTKGGEPLFISTSNNNQGERLTTRTISQIAKDGLRALGLDGREFTAHSLRHTTAVNILRAGGSLEDAQGVLRHSNPATTQIYTATIREEMRIRRAPEELLDQYYN